MGYRGFILLGLNRRLEKYRHVNLEYLVTNKPISVGNQTRNGTEPILPKTIINLE